MTHLLRRLVREESGQDVIEYALVAAAISIIAIPTVPAIGTTILGVFQAISTAVQGIPTGTGGGGS